ncbi:MAG: hypothetical protein WDN50_01450 [Bradyrhizobium sp.]
MKSKSAESWTRARPAPTTDETIASTSLRIRFSKPARRSSPMALSVSPLAPSASN